MAICTVYTRAFPSVLTVSHQGAYGIVEVGQNPLLHFFQILTLLMKLNAVLLQHKDLGESL